MSSREFLAAVPMTRFMKGLPSISVKIGPCLKPAILILFPATKIRTNLTFAGKDSLLQKLALVEWPFLVVAFEELLQGSRQVQSILEYRLN